jgi:hypothetical protein
MRLSLVAEPAHFIPDKKLEKERKEKDFFSHVKSAVEKKFQAGVVDQNGKNQGDFEC